MIHSHIVDADVRDKTVRSPSVSVILAAYNAEEYIGEAIESILSQTFQDFELIIVNDGSTDQTEDLVSNFDDPRIVYLNTDENRGVAKARNLGESEACGRFIAVHDADDLSEPSRFERQVEFLDQNPEVGALGTQGWLITSDELENLDVPESNADIQSILLGRNCMLHSSLMIRHIVLREIGGYDESYSAALDLDLLLRLSEVTQLANLSDRLYKKRSVIGSISIGELSLQQKRNSMRAVEKAIDRRKAKGLPHIPHAAYALNCLSVACAEAAFGDEDRIRLCLSRGLEVDALVVEKESAARVLANHALSYSNVLGTESRESLKIINRVFEFWPADLDQNPLWKRTRGLVLRDIAYVNYRDEKWKGVLPPAVKGYVLWPNAGNNRGLLSTCMRALSHSVQEIIG